MKKNTYYTIFRKEQIPGNKIFIDTSVLFYLMAADKLITSDVRSKQIEYANFFKYLRKNNVEYYYPAVTLSEYINLFERKTREKISKENADDNLKNTKTFRKSSHWLPTLNELNTYKKVLSQLGFKFVEIDITHDLNKKIWAENQVDYIDFMDRYIYECMKSEGILNIVTDDYDYLKLKELNVYMCR